MFWICLVLIVLFFIPSYARIYFDYQRDMQRIREQRAHNARMEQIARESLEDTKRRNEEFLRLTRQRMGLEKAI